jgi:hypothetical protein
MIIKFSKDIELEDWSNDGLNRDETIWKRRMIVNNPTLPRLVVSVRKNLPIIDQCYANFYGPLRFLHKYFPEYIIGDLESAKEQVDNFLIKMSGLAAFL